MIYQDKVTLRKVLWSVAVVIAVIVIQHIPVYGISPKVVKSLFNSASPLRFTDTLTGGSMSQLAVGGFGVMSLIMAGIIIQLLGVVYPKIEKIHADGEHGRRVFDRINMALGVVITAGLGLLITVNMSHTSLYSVDGFLRVIPFLEWIIGTVAIVALSQSVHLHGIGNGMTMILAANIAARIPSDIAMRMVFGQTWSNWCIAIVTLLVITIVAVYLQCGFIRVKIQQTRKTLSIMNAEGVIPIPMVASSVLPVVYAQSVITLPTVVKVMNGWNDKMVPGWLKPWLDATNPQNWYNPTNWTHIAGFVVYVGMILLTAGYASKLSFSSAEVANQMRERGDVIVDVAPGKESELYLERRRKKLARVGVILLLIITVVPDIVLSRLGVAGFSFMGTSLIIMMAAFWDLRLRITGRLKHHNSRYLLFGKKA